MSAMGDRLGRMREGISSFGRDLGEYGRDLGRRAHRQAKDVAVMVEERPDVGPIEVDLPYPLPTREQPLALVLFYGASLTLVVSLTLVASSYILLGQVPSGLVNAVGGIAVVLALVGNLTIIARPVHENASTTLRPVVGAGIPLLNALHYWFNPVVAVLGVVYVATLPSNNWLMPVAAMVLVAWAVTGLLLKLPRASPWNGPMLRRWAGTLHKRPFVYVALLVLVSIGFLSDLMF